jgi:lysophospholipase L1-like esterase
MGELKRKLRAWRLPALCILLAGSVAANLVLARYALQVVQTLRIDPFELEHYARIRPPQAAAPGVRRVVLFGDSRARSWPEPQSLPGVAFENRGIGYQSSTQALGRLEEDALALAPSVLVLQAGVNDLKLVARDAAQRRRFVERCKQNLAAMVARSVAAHAHVVILTIFPVGAIPLYLRGLAAPDTREAIEEVNAFLRTLRGPDVSVLESAEVLADREGLLRGEYQRDYLHLNDAGYAAIDAALHTQLLRLLPQPMAAGAR